MLCIWLVWRGIEFGKELLELAGIEIGEYMTVHDDGGDVALAG